jgi:hypothetical protein
MSDPMSVSRRLVAASVARMSAATSGGWSIPAYRCAHAGYSLLCDGGPTMWAELMDELREIRLGLKPKRRTGPSVGERLQAAYETVMAKGANG